MYWSKESVFRGNNFPYSVVKQLNRTRKTWVIPWEVDSVDGPIRDSRPRRAHSGLTKLGMQHVECGAKRVGQGLGGNLRGKPRAGTVAEQVYDAAR